jgi:hypothetical protein
MQLRRMIVSVLAFWMVAMLLPTSASAQFRLRVEDLATGQGVVITDGLGADPFKDGTLLVHMSDSDIALSITTAQSSNNGGIPTPLPGVLGELFLKSITLTTNGAANVAVTLEDTGFTAPANSSLQLTTQMVDATAGSPGFAAYTGTTLTSQSWVNTTPCLGPGTCDPYLGTDQVQGSIVGNPMGLIPASSAATTPPLAFTSAGSPISLNNTATAAFTNAGSYALFTQVLMNFTGAGNISFNQDMTVALNSQLPTPTPEPGSLMLIGTGIVALASRMRRGRLTRV